MKIVPIRPLSSVLYTSCIYAYKTWTFVIIPPAIRKHVYTKNCYRITMNSLRHTIFFIIYIYIFRKYLILYKNTCRLYRNSVFNPLHFLVAWFQCLYTFVAVKSTSKFMTHQYGLNLRVGSFWSDKGEKNLRVPFPLRDWQKLKISFHLYYDIHV